MEPRGRERHRWAKPSGRNGREHMSQRGRRMSFKRFLSGSTVQRFTWRQPDMCRSVRFILIQTTNQALQSCAAQHRCLPLQRFNDSTLQRSPMISFRFNGSTIQRFTWRQPASYERRIKHEQNQVIREHRLPVRYRTDSPRLPVGFGCQPKRSRCSGGL
jgi:hypothetical protein